MQRSFLLFTWAIIWHSIIPCFLVAHGERRFAPWANILVLEYSADKKPLSLQTWSNNCLLPLFCPDCSVLEPVSICKDCSILSRELKTPGRPDLLLDHKLAVGSVVFSPKGNLLGSRSIDGTVCIWQVHTRKLIAKKARSSGSAPTYSPIRFTPDGKVFAWIEADEANEHWCRFWAVEDNKLLPSIKLGCLWMPRFALSPNCRYVVVAEDKDNAPKKVISLDKKWSDKRFEIHVKMDLPAQFLWGPPATSISYDEKLLASSGQGTTVYVHEIATSKELRSVEHDSITLMDVAISPNSDLLASVGFSSDFRAPLAASSIVCWHVPSGRKLVEFKKIRGLVKSIVFAEGGLLFAWSTDAGESCVIDVFTGRQLLARTDQSRACSLAFSPDCSTLALGMTDGKIVLWTLRPGYQAKSEMQAEEFLKVWEDLGSADPKRAQESVWRLTDNQAETVLQVKNVLRPVDFKDAECFDQLIAELDNEKYNRRELATKRLCGMGVLAEPALQQALEREPSEEMKARINKVLKLLPGNGIGDADTLRKLRAVWILYRIGTVEAWQVLEGFAQGAPSCLTKEAQAALRCRASPK
jgi:WD40 repeat protein